MLILSNEDVDALISMPECIAALEEGYRELAHGRGTNRRRSDSLVPTANSAALYSLKTMDGIAPNFGVSAVRINSDIVHWPTRGGTQRREKIPAAPNGRWVGLVLLFSTETGEPLAIFPDGVLQRMRVGATNGLAAKYLARSDARTVGLLGSGWQAGTQVTAITAVRKIERIRCYSPNAEHRAEFARAMAQATGVDIIPVGSPEQAVKDADVVMCATNTIDHVYFERWVESGMHLSSIKRPEIEPAAIKRAQKIVIHTHDASPMHITPPGLVVPEKEEGKGWSLLQEIDFDSLPTLPELVAGKTTGRAAPEDVTCFLNNIGMGYQFAAVGATVYRKAKAQGRGRELPTEWFTEDVHP